VAAADLGKGTKRCSGRRQLPNFAEGLVSNHSEILAHPTAESAPHQLVR
jgi:hypothetical protein